MQFSTFCATGVFGMQFSDSDQKGAFFWWGWRSTKRELNVSRLYCHIARTTAHATSTQAIVAIDKGKVDTRGRLLV